MQTAAPFFDTTALRHELTAIFNQSRAPTDARPPVIDRLKTLVVHARACAKDQLLASNNGRQCAANLSQFQDALVSLIFDYTIAHVYRATNPSDAERMSVVATGGYGRGLLAPGSDIDLLFLLPYKQTPWGESVAEYMLYVLWDLGFKVGHATRTVDQCIKLSLSDMTIRTSLLDARLIHADRQLFAEFEDRFRSDVVTGTARAFIDAKLAERDDRVRRTGESRYKVEPNVKDGKGGLRDLHMLHWLSKYLFGQEVGQAAVEAKIYTDEEARTFRRCEDYLWTVRCHLHFLTNRAEEVLNFDIQPLLAEQLGYKRHGGLRSVERFMKHYFLTAKEVGDLSTIICGALEMQQLKSSPGVSRFLKPLSWVKRREVRTKTDFKIENERLNIVDAEVFARNPVNLIAFFLQAEETGAFLHPDAIRVLRHSWRLIDDKLRTDPHANKIFLDLLSGGSNPETALRRMNEAGVLGRFIPEFGRVVGMMQFNMYHHFTVDEHLLRTVGNLIEIERGTAADELPLATRIFHTIQNRRALFVAAFLHDIGKGRIEDHSIVGARIARTLCPRLGLSAAETELIVWLIEEHLTMSNVAHSRDLSDPKTLQDFAAKVQSPERLKLLTLLTVADIRAVGPGVWNGWKGQLIRTLYAETEPRVAGGHTMAKRSERIEEAQEALRRALHGWTSDDARTFVKRHYDSYWLTTETADQVAHAKLLQGVTASGSKIATRATTDAFTAITELTVVAPNHPRLLALFAGACSAAGANISGARIMTTRDGIALDTFLLARDFNTDEDELRRAKRIGDTIDRLLQGKERLAELLKKRRSTTKRTDAFSVEPEVLISNSLSERLTVIEVAGRDRPGLLYDLTSALSDLSLDIASAHITTFGEKAVDVFYVTDLTAKQITSETRQAAIKQRLIQVLSAYDRAAAAPAIVKS